MPVKEYNVRIEIECKVRAWSTDQVKETLKEDLVEMLGEIEGIDVEPVKKPYILVEDW